MLGSPAPALALAFWASSILCLRSAATGPHGTDGKVMTVQSLFPRTTGTGRQINLHDQTVWRC